jgi:hypothetical protein
MQDDIIGKKDLNTVKRNSVGKQHQIKRFPRYFCVIMDLNLIMFIIFAFLEF